MSRVQNDVASMQTISCAMVQWVQRQHALRMLSASASLMILLQVSMLLATCTGLLHSVLSAGYVAGQCLATGRACSDTFAGNELSDPPVPTPGGKHTPWWVWLLVCLAGLVILALAALLLLRCLRRRQATRLLALAPPAHKARTCAQLCLWMLCCSGTGAALSWLCPQECFVVRQWLTCSMLPGPEHFSIEPFNC
jgi:hypothetical protein